MNKIHRVGFDINSTIDNFGDAILNLYNEKYNDRLSIEDITDYDLTKFIKKDCEDIWGEFINYELLKELKILDGAKDFVNYCHDNFEVRFVTASFPCHIPIFWELLKNNFDWLKNRHFCRIEDKQEYNVDILFDDYEKNLIGGNFEKVLITRPWNKNVIRRGIKRIDDLSMDTIPLINQLLNSEK